ncbi:MAG: Large polyvalent protein associated domain 29 [Gammaproteobacteria bacterium]|jgi:hypothetical protein|nr:Large polyvalent protein associated domain 29 [Gammaproteobacteria bacterium]
MAAKECAKLIRKDLKAAMPSYKFSVTTSGIINPALTIMLVKFPQSPKSRGEGIELAREILPRVKQIVNRYHVDKSGNKPDDYCDVNFIPFYQVMYNPNEA